MKVTIQLEPSAGDHDSSFTTMEYVRGTVNLCLKRGEAVSKITLTLQGSLITSVITAASNPLDGTLHTVDNHKLFELSQNLFPYPGVPILSTGFSMLKGTNIFPFQIRFPIFAMCNNTNGWAERHNATLPPSIKVQASRNVASGEVQYWLSVKIERPGQLMFDVTAQRELKFLPLDPVLPPPMLQPACCRRTILLVAPSAGFKVFPLAPKTAQRVDNCLVILEAVLPSPSVLYTRGALPLRIFSATDRTSVDSSPPVLLRTLCVTIRTETVVTAGLSSTTWTSFNELISISGLGIQLEESGTTPSEISKHLWKDAIVPDIAPSFTTCLLMQQHVLIVAAGLSYGPKGTIQTVKSSINVEVHSGIKPAPALMEMGQLDGAQNSEQTAFIPWRVGSERHLGITRRPDWVSTGTPPPPY